MNELNMDWDRAARTSIDEAVLCAGKSLAQLQAVLAQAEQKNRPLLCTRLTAAAFAELGALGERLDFDPASGTAFYLPQGRAPAPRAVRVAVVSGGSSDVPVAREAVRTLQFHGVQAARIYDVGVAGLWRLQARLSELREQQVIICVAGMDAALPTVLAGLVPALVVAVPTSTGYGMARGGETALNALLCSCAQGLVVVNIDNGFGAACAALRALSI